MKKVIGWTLLLLTSFVCAGCATRSTPRQVAETTTSTLSSPPAKKAPPPQEDPPVMPVRKVWKKKIAVEQGILKPKIRQTETKIQPAVKSPTEPAPVNLDEVPSYRNHSSLVEIDDLRLAELKNVRITY